LAAAAEEGNHAAIGIQFARRSNQVLQGIISVRVIDNHQERLPKIDSLESSRNAFQFTDAFFDHFV